ncbi:MAG: SDR family oxidoreductase [Dehalococcoidia bacterium]|nr:SDR family oxidoreductase [Dehalococcoidia bacterium]MDZ4246858.1 SDR family oxidoreductase [Dehalococcoidia bacterium]
MGELLKGKAAVITGGGGGLGRAVSLLMAEEGAKIVVNDIGGSKDGSGGSNSPADVTVQEIKSRGGEAVASYDSIVSFTAAEKLIQTCVETFGKIDILVNLAGNLRDRMIFNMAEEDFDSVIAVHLKGTWNCTRHACAAMRQQRTGRIINTSSRAAFGNPGQSNYASAKAGIIGMTQTVAREMGRYGVTVNAIMPLAATRFSATAEVAATKEKRAAAGIQAAVQLGEVELPPPEDIAPIVVYLASDEAADVNGQLFFSCGGEITLYTLPQPKKSIFSPGRWDVGELASVFPKTLGKGLVNPAPVQPPK